MIKTSTSYLFLFFVILFSLSNAYAQGDPIPGGCGNVGPNLVINPEFEDGNTGFTNTFTFNPAGYTCSYGDYTIASTVVHDPNVVCYNAPGFNLQSIWNVTDRVNRTSPVYVDGNFMIVDPCGGIGNQCSTDDLSGVIWQQTVDVCPNNSYAFSVFVKNIYSSDPSVINYPGSDIPPDFELTINGEPVTGYYVDGVLSPGGTFLLPKMPLADSAVWFQISGTWESGNSTSADLVMKNLVLGNQGNDLAVDGIYMGLCGKQVALDIVGDICQDDASPSPVSFTPNPVTQNASGWQFYRWFRDGVEVQADQNGTYVPALDPTNGYKGEYVMVAYVDPTGTTCGHESAPIVVRSNTNPDCPAIFPVEKLAFDVSQQAQKANLRWSTSLEINNKGFDVEMARTDKRVFEKIGFVEGNGTTNLTTNYEFLSPSLASGTYVFRLNQIDFDGKSTYSDYVELSLDLAGKYLVRISPNPVTSESQILIDVEDKQEVSISFINSNGQLVKSLPDHMMEPGTSLDQKIGDLGLPAGIYFMQVQGWNFNHFEKVVLVE